MRNMKKTMATAMALLLTAASVAGCGGGTGGGTNLSSTDLTQTVDKNKKQISFSVFNGGYGYAWAVDAAREWNETNDEYQVIVVPNKDEWYTFASNLEAGTCKFDIMLNTPTAAEYAKGWLENLNF